MLRFPAHERDVEGGFTLIRRLLQSIHPFDCHGLPPIVIPQSLFSNVDSFFLNGEVHGTSGGGGGGNEERLTNLGIDCRSRL